MDSFAVESHLKGQTIIGTYSIRTDDTCSFLACDFDESSWKEDVLAYKQAARELGIEVYIERSRSGTEVMLGFSLKNTSMQGLPDHLAL